MSDFKATSLSGSLTKLTDGTSYLIAGANTTITTGSNGSVTIATTGGAANAFSTFAVSGQSNVVADSGTDTLTFVASGGMTITTDAASDIITFSSADTNTQNTLDDAYDEGGSGSGAIIIVDSQPIQLQTVSGETGLAISGSLDLGYSGTNTVNNYSFAHGDSVTSTGAYSYAQGSYVTATGDYSYSQGDGNQATGIGTHAEGYLSIASGDYSHSEGYQGQSKGQYSHAEGYNTEAIGQSSHAEGYNTEAVGNYSHTAGIGTISSGSYQNVVGKYNKRNNTDSLFVVGFGSGDNNSQRDDIFLVNSGSVIIGSGTLGTDVNFYVTGSKDSKELNIKGTSVFAGDTVISGAIYSGRLISLEDQNSYVKVDLGNVEILSDEMVKIQHRSGDPNTSADTNFFVSGSMGSRGTSTRGTSVFGGDVVISGTLYGGSPLKVSGGMEVTGSLIMEQGSEIICPIGAGLTGSLQEVSEGIPYLIAGSNINITTSSIGQITIESTGILASAGGSNTQVIFNDGGSQAGDANFTFDNTTSTLTVTNISGSLTKLSDGTSYLIAGNNVTITTGSNGAVTIESAGTSYTAGNGLVLDSSEFLINDSIVATISGSTFAGVTKHNQGLSGSLTQLIDGSSYLIAGSNIAITSASNGAVTISSLGSSNISVTNNTTENATLYPTFVDGTSGDQEIEVDSSGLTYNPSSNTLTTSTFAGNLSGNATSADTIDITATSTNATHYLTFVDSSSTTAGETLRVDSGITYNPSTNDLTVLGYFQTDKGIPRPTSVLVNTSTSSSEDRWLKIAQTFNGHDTQNTSFASFLVVFTGLEASVAYDGDFAYIVNVKFTGNSSSPYYNSTGTYITVEPLHAGNLEGFDPTTDVQITFDNTTLPTVVELWIKSNESHKHCFVSHLGGSNSVDTSYADPGFEILTNQNTAVSVTSLGTDIFGEWSSKVFNNIKAYTGLSGSLTQLTDGTSYLVASSNITITSASNGQVQISAPNLQTSLQYYNESSISPSDYPLASGQNSVSIGDSSLAAAPDSFVIGNNSTASFGYADPFNNQYNFVIAESSTISGYSPGSSIMGGYQNTISGSYSSYVLGGDQNEIKGHTLEDVALGRSSKGHTISGGSLNKIHYRNTNVSNWYQTIGGGYNNVISGTIASTIAGGYQNTIGGLEGTYYSFIGGGSNNKIGNNNDGSFYSAILGGTNNLSLDHRNYLIGSYLTSSIANDVKIGFGSELNATSYVTLQSSYVILTNPSNEGTGITGSTGDLSIRAKENLYLTAEGDGYAWGRLYLSSGNDTPSLYFDLDSSPELNSAGDFTLDVSGKITLNSNDSIDLIFSGSSGKNATTLKVGSYDKIIYHNSAAPLCLSYVGNQDIDTNSLYSKLNSANLNGAPFQGSSFASSYLYDAALFAGNVKITPYTAHYCESIDPGSNGESTYWSVSGGLLATTPESMTNYTNVTRLYSGTGPRTLTTAYKLPGGVHMQIQFYLSVGSAVPDVGSPLVLQYSEDGISWTNIQTFAGTSYPASTTGTEVDIDFATPPDSDYYIRFYQGSASGTSAEEWEISAVSIRENEYDSDGPLIITHPFLKGGTMESSAYFMKFESASGYPVGSIYASTSTPGTVVYSAFTGAHSWKLNVGSTYENFMIGKIVATEGSKEEPIYICEPTTFANDKSVIGILMSDVVGNEEGNENEKHRSLVALGNYKLLVCDEGGNIDIGDFISSSNTKGAGMKQDTDHLMNYTFAKATEAVDWSLETGTTKLISCILVSG